jgi:hypothetical protein
MAGKGTTVQITAADLAFLERRGARSHRGGGTFSRSVVLHRTLQMLRDCLDQFDPRKTRGMPDEMHRLVVQELPEPWTLKSFEVEHLALILERAPGFAAAAAAARVDPAAVLATVAAMSYAEKLALVDHALQEQAPAAAAASPEEP